MADPAILVRDLTKTYVSNKKAPGIVGGIKALFSREKTYVHAVQSINFEIAEGEVVGFLGPNGAGKTTTLKMLSGILNPTSGTCDVLGFRPFDRRPEYLRQLSLVMGNKMQLWWDLPAWDSFLVAKELYEIPADEFKRRADRLIELLELGDKVQTQVRKLSLGERMKCELVAALLHHPRVLFLDEPTIGLDVMSQLRIREFLRELHREQGNTILLTSHYMQDVQELCPRVIVINHGRVVFEGSLEKLSAQFADTRRIRLTLTSPVDSADLARFGTVVSDDSGVSIDVPRKEVAAVASGLLTTLPVADIAIEEVSIEEVLRDLFQQAER